ncbi:hypothetical protein D3C87_1461270 [compost metagenome]
MVAGSSRLAAVHSGQPVELHDRRHPDFAVGFRPRRRPLGTAGPDGPELATAWHQAPAAPGRADHIRPVDRADVHRQPRRPGASGNVDPQSGSPPENLSDPFAGHGRTPDRTSQAVRCTGAQQLYRPGTSARRNRASGDRRQSNGRHHAGSRQPRAAHCRCHPGSQSPDRSRSRHRRGNSRSDSATVGSGWGNRPDRDSTGQGQRRNRWCGRRDQGHRRPDQSAGAQRRHRSGPCR